MAAKRASKKQTCNLSSDEIKDTLDRVQNLIALRDEVLRLYKEAEKAMGDDREVNIDGNGVNCLEALHTLKPLKALADKCVIKSR